MKHIESYLRNSSWRITENANFNYSYSGLLAYISSHEMARFALKKMPREASRAHRDGYLHIHNLEGPIIPYCCGHDLLNLLQKGVRSANIASRPAKHFSAVCDHVVNFFFMAQLESAGAQAFSDFNTILAPFVAYDKLSFQQIRQHIQRLVYNLNFACRQAFQTPFTNLTFNLRTPKMLADMPVIIGGEPQSDTYSDFEDEALLILDAFCDVLLERDIGGRPFTFPIPTLNIVKDTNWDDGTLFDVMKVSAELGSFYFQNYVGSGIDENSVRAMCCRLNLDLSQLATARGYWNFSGGTGSIGVVSLNAARLGYLSKSESELFERLEGLLDVAKTYLLWKEEMIRKNRKLTPILNYYDVNYDHYFRTIGIIGLNEMCLNFAGVPLVECPALVEKVLARIRAWCRETQEETGKLWNLEMTPGEGSSYRLAFIDRKRYKNIITLGTPERPYYSTLLVPPSTEIDLFERIDIEQRLLPLFSGGTVFRIFLGEKLPDVNALRSLTRTIIEKTRIPYFDYTATFSLCTNCGKVHRWVHNVCPDCGSECDVYSRVVGYYRPFRKYNPGKLQEALERKPSIEG